MAHVSILPLPRTRRSHRTRFQVVGRARGLCAYRGRRLEPPGWGPLRPLAPLRLRSQQVHQGGSANLRRGSKGQGRGGRSPESPAAAGATREDPTRRAARARSPSRHARGAAPPPRLDGPSPNWSRRDAQRRAGTRWVHGLGDRQRQVGRRGAHQTGLTRGRGDRESPPCPGETCGLGKGGRTLGRVWV